MIKFRSEAVYDEFVVMGFKRLVNTGDVDEDYPFQLGNQTNLIWAYGEVNSTTKDINKHTEYGVSSIVIPSLARNLFTPFYLFVFGLIV